jgi:hypothetical protein
MKNKKVAELFKQSAIRLAKKKTKGQNALFMLGGKTKAEHEAICPFRSVLLEECPLCTIEAINNL